jgi:hypothetical protein
MTAGSFLQPIGYLAQCDFCHTLKNRIREWLLIEHCSKHRCSVSFLTSWAAENRRRHLGMYPPLRLQNRRWITGKMVSTVKRLPASILASTWPLVTYSSAF